MSSPSSVRFTLSDIASRLNAQLHGDSSATITAIRPLENAGETDLTFLIPGRRSTELREVARSRRVGALLTAELLSDVDSPQIVISNPLAAVAALAPLFRRFGAPETGIHPTAIVHPLATVATDATVGPYCVVGEAVVIGSRVVLHPHVVIYPGAQIGERSVLHAGAVVREEVIIGKDCVIQNGVVVGGEGFGYFSEPGVTHHRIPHIGTVWLADGVDIGANSTIDRATLGETRIGRHTKLDNLVMVGHNVQVGERTLICGQVGISGSVRVGNDVVLGGQVGVSNHCNIGDGARAGGQAGIIADVPPKSDIAGFPAQPHLQWRRTTALANRLPEFAKRLRRLEKHLGMKTSDES